MQTKCSYELSNGTIHIWTLPTTAADAVVAKFEQVLSPDEIEFALRFRFRHLRNSFVIRRGALRYLLGRYKKLEPASIQFNYRSKGKPSLSPADGLQFNMTHSGGIAAIALGAHCQIGIDLEKIRPLPEMQRIANRVFCLEEVTEIMSLPQGERMHAFFRCWTRKEAYVKAIGDGIFSPFNSFRVTVQDNVPARFVYLGGDATASSLMLHDLNLASDCAAALAYCDGQRSVSIFRVVDPAESLPTQPGGSHAYGDI
jgi:4'-phosphopantetheinyl transferase